VPLKGVVVVEIGHSVSAPFAGLVLGQLGAEVIKVEHPNGGDPARKWGAPANDGSSALFQAVNREKSSVALDLRDPQESEALLELIDDRADVVIQNLRPNSIEELGFGAANLSRRKPSLIVCNLSAFGSRGPMQSRPGYDALMQACAGLMSVTGEERGPPVRIGVSIVDIGAGLWSVVAIVAALLERARTGKGGIVHTSLYETALAWMGVHIAELSASGVPPRRHGSGAPQVVPYEMFETADGSLMVGAGNDELFAKLCDMLDRAQWNRDQRFRTNPDRVENRSALSAMLRAIFLTQPTSRWRERLDAAGIPNAPLRHLSEVMTDEQTVSLGILQHSPRTGLTTVGVPIQFDGEREKAGRPAPRLGEHNQQLLAKALKRADLALDRDPGG
jgi:crotonobetainyl-CoA:carnitine CoA-transferase CaiB-like acyl-CoA transferase